MVLIQIVTGLPPQIDGIADYALQLARQLRERHSLSTYFIVGDPRWTGGPLEGFGATKVAARTTEGLLAAFETARAELGTNNFKILLHYVPHGYEKRGCPFWLANALEAWEKLEPGKLNVVFHEVQVSDAPPWSSGFWVPPLQRSLCVRIARLAVFQYTNTEIHRRWLEDWGSGRIGLIPNISTVGEPRTNPPFSERTRDIIIFGRPTHRRLTYEYGTEALRALVALIGAQGIVDVGAPIAGDTRKEVGGVPIRRRGALEAAEVSEAMSQAVASFTYYPIPMIGKSGIYAVSCAHGVVPFIYDNNPKPHSCPGLVPGEDYVPMPFGRSDLPLPDLQVLSQSAFDGYQKHAAWVMADMVMKGIQ